MTSLKFHGGNLFAERPHNNCSEEDTKMSGQEKVVKLLKALADKSRL
jgi:hypothetical protein